MLAEADPTGAAGGAALPVLVTVGSFLAIRFLGGTPADLGWRRPRSPSRSVLLGVAAGVGASILFVCIGILLRLLFPDIDTLAPYKDALEDPVSTALLAVGAVVLAPVGEEVFWRGLVLTMLVRPRVPEPSEGPSDRPGIPWHLPAILVTSVLWAAIHGNPAAFLQLVIFGLILGRLRALDSGSLVMPVMAHATNNLITVTMLLMSLGAS